jgi:hypothetical protein
VQRRSLLLLAPVLASLALLATAPPRSGRILTPRDVQETGDPNGRSPREGDPVVVEGVVVAVSPHYDFFYVASSEGGPWSGLKVEGPCVERSPGEFVSVHGDVVEAFGETRLRARRVGARRTAPLPPPAVVTLADLAANAEPWEGVLVRVESVAVESGTSDFGEWRFSDPTGSDGEVDDEFWTSYIADPGDAFTSITGLLAFGFSDFHVEPRGDFDIEGFVSGRSFDGRIELMVSDDEARPIPAKLTLFPVGGFSLDLGPDDRAEGSDDAAFLPVGGGEVRLPSGTYDIVVSRGPEYGLHAERVVVPSGGSAFVAATLPREVDTSGWISGDFHLHCAPSSDTPLPLHGRVLSLAAEGVEWVVATDHNMVTDYTPIIEQLDLGDWMRSSIGDEITTRDPSYGHFNAWPLARGSTPRPWESVTPEALFAAAREGPLDEIVQVNHPSIPDWGNQYFDVYEVDANTGEPGQPGFSWSFDALEVFNGRYLDQGLQTFETWMRMLNRGRVITATGNSDSHHLVFAEPGYPRSWVRCDATSPASASEEELVEAVRRGETLVSYGPFLGFEANGAGPGALASAPGGDVTLSGRVQCASWLSVSEAHVYANGRILTSVELAASRGGPQDVQVGFVDHPTVDTWYVLFVEGDGNLEPVRRGTGFRPLAFTNPVRVDVDGDGKFTPPGDVADLAAIEEIDPVDANGVPTRLTDWVVVHGCALTDTRFVDPTLGSFYVDDGTGGVQVRESAGSITELQRGDAVKVSGTVGQVLGQTTLVDAIVEVEEGEPDCAPARPTSLAEIGPALEPWEGRVLGLSDLNVVGGSWPAGGAEGAVTISDGTGTALLLVPQGIVIPPEASMLVDFDLTALLTQHDATAPYFDTYTLTLRSAGDLPLAGAGSTAAAASLRRPGFGAPFPNPFRAAFRIPYSAPAGTRLTLEVHDVRGAVVRRMEASSAGQGELVFDGRDRAGRPLASGVYWVRVAGGNLHETVKIVKVD